MAWDLDPELALQTRLSFGRHAILIAAVLNAGMGLAFLVGGAPRVFMVGLVSLVSLASLVVALPFAAIHVLGLDGEGRLDRQRLTGRSGRRRVTEADNAVLAALVILATLATSVAIANLSAATAVALAVDATVWTATLPLVLGRMPGRPHADQQPQETGGSLP